MTYPIRPISEAEWPAFSAVLSEAFGWTPAPLQTERWKAHTEFDRTLAAFDGDTIAGVTAIFSMTMTVPGGALPVAGVTSVSVLPSHRRRGILSSLMRRQLTDVHERGEAVAALYASESAIYGRYGYGRAASELGVTITTSASGFVKNAPHDPELRLRVVTPAQARQDLEKVFAGVVTERPGRYVRDEQFWNAVLADEEPDRDGWNALRGLLAEDASGVRGYALFRIKSRWDDDGIPNGELRVHEIEARDPAAYALLWRGVLDRDLVTKVTAGVPVDAPLTALLANPRQLRAGWSDELWIRVVDVEKALPARSYAAPVDTVIEVEDDVCPWNARRWRLTAGAGSASCTPVEAAPDVTLPVSALGSAYLGDGELGALLDAGLLKEHTPGAVRALATALSWSPKPWAGLVF
ncbi:GNAT family N-acetyltransferase [Nonomuraea typhae]|uniref:GNAT family N-acetyltransferase n=1 Tax=Nonomuraea typhae TaxID=2603600 RepID=UPI0012F9F6BB|nr:GNAT family N-acetyltransferase [Nonomuraea typhae]